MFQFSSVDDITDMKDMCKAFHIEAQLNSRNGNFSSLICLQALSSVIGQPIKSVYSVRKNVKLFHLFTKTFHPSKPISDQVLTIFWYSTLPNISKPNHFVLCISPNLVRSRSRSSYKRKEQIFFPEYDSSKRKKQSVLNFKRADVVSSSSNASPAVANVSSTSSDVFPAQLCCIQLYHFFFIEC